MNDPLKSQAFSAEQPSGLKSEERIRTLEKMFTDAAEVEKDFWKQAAEDERFYIGDQWDAGDRETLTNEGRPALTYNHIAPVVNVVNGWHRQNRLDHKVFPRKGGMGEVAEIMTSILKHIKQSKNGEWEISYAHLMGLVSGKSYLSINLDYDDDPLFGDLYYEFNPCFDILLDPYGMRYDLSD